MKTVISALLLVFPCFGFVLVPNNPAGFRIFPLEATSTTNELFPVISQIEGVQWEGDCRYVNGELAPVSMPLTGGTRYDLDKDGKCTLTSFLVFPHGKTRQVVMEGKKADKSTTAMQLNPAVEDGPISMRLTEVPPDTILVNEIDRASGRIIMTSSLSIVNNGAELVQVAHEVGKGNGAIEGHQIWRLKRMGSFD